MTLPIAIGGFLQFRADFEPIAERIIVTTAPGPVTADPSVLPFRHLRKGLRIIPRSA